MGPLVQEVVAQPGQVQAERLTWMEDPAVKQLLDVVASILAEEYIQTVKRNPDEFSRKASTT